MMKFRSCLALLVTGWLLTGCTSDLTGTSYSAREARVVQQVRFGTLVDVQSVKIDGTKGEVGSVAGAAIGGVAGSSIGGKREGRVGTVLGALAGGVLGNMAEKKITEKGGVELTVQMENGRYLSIVQEVEPSVQFSRGDKVKVLTRGSNSRVVPFNQ